jgi:nitrate reductase NapE component
MMTETKPKGTRNVWIIVFVVLVLVCFCLLAAAVVGVGLATNWAFDIWGGGGLLAAQETSQVERSFTLGSAPSLTVDSFAGKITIQAGVGDTIRVVATKKAHGLANLDRISIDFTEETNGLRIRTRKPVGLSNASVELQITAPAGTQVDLHTGAGSTDVQGLSGSVTVDTGAGSVDIRDVSGTLNAHTGAGSVDVRGAVGRVQLQTGAGSITYQGNPEGDCRFESGTGSIDLILPADLNFKVDLGTGVGGVTVAYNVVGQVTRREVTGTIGTGADGSIYAHTGTGSIDLKRK